MATDKDSKWTLHRRIPSDTATGSALVHEIMDAMTKRNWSPQDLFRVQLAYEEAIVNAIRHGNRHDCKKTVEVKMSCDDERVEIQITDQGCGFDPDSIPDPRSEELLEVPGGRGVLLMSEIMSEISYNKAGNQITMIKHKENSESQDE
ncbi:Serine/threonine-protein kinase BtrW [Novipirellula aureliae]|uniref:Serine/threonine-protein kinase BtrW n=1 Tax=Novipirellula aureliae TaxID=2527966 RepID=A0A5C6E5P1_9BACT|nr:ATP-binding protein [Novipirellula aureliae]TWU42941.1 Serine/threonine-protein kinase BtrW [Novipirellula aureliae]